MAYNLLQFSRKNENEMEWVILHESAHYIFKHNLTLPFFIFVFFRAFEKIF